MMLTLLFPIEYGSVKYFNDEKVLPFLKVKVVDTLIIYEYCKS